MEYFRIYRSRCSSPSEPVTGKQLINYLSLETTRLDLDLQAHGTSQVCQELFVGDRRNVNILGQLPNESFCNISEFSGSELLTTSDKPVRIPDLKKCLETYEYVNTRCTVQLGLSSSKSLSAFPSRQENPVNYIHPLLSADRKDVVLEVECGSNKGHLYLSRLCRGSEGSCILFQNTWLTPNQFQSISGREAAKDWKRSIRHRGRSVKLLLSKGILAHNPECYCQTGISLSTDWQVRMALR
jgi:hypothetical protein